MSSNSSTSSFEPNRLERAPRSAVPIAAIGLVILIGVIETTLHHHRVWFADRAAWQWQVKGQLLDQGVLNGDVAIIGTSVIFHSIDAGRVNELSGSPRRFVNLALNGASMQHFTQLMQRYFDNGKKLDHLLIELREVRAQQSDWLKGPYWRFWASFKEFGQSKSYYFEPSLLISFAANRLLTSYAYRRALDNWVFSCGRAMAIDTTYRDRNQQIAIEMKNRLGYSSSQNNPILTPDKIPPPRPRPWWVTPESRAWLDRLLTLCDRQGVRVSVLLPPSPRFLVQLRKQSHFYKDFDEFVTRLKVKYPTLAITVLAPTGYELADFSDDRHFSNQGNVKITRDIARWVASLDDLPDTPTP